MSRPEPRVIATAHKDDSVLEVLATPAIWLILYRGEPFNLRSKEWRLDGPKFLYKKTSYASLGSARKQVRRLNELFNSQDFTVTKAG
jgi:hypothetical protein